MVRSRLAAYVMPFGFGQRWDMFAPNPPLSNNYLEAEVTFADGSRQTWRFPQLNQLGYFQRYRRERHRKWAGERVIAAGRPHPAGAEAAARFAVRQVGRRGSWPRTVELVRYRAQIPSPQRGRLPPYTEAPRDWARQPIYLCEFDADGHITRRWAAATRPASTQAAATQPAGAPWIAAPAQDLPVDGTQPHADEEVAR